LPPPTPIGCAPLGLLLGEQPELSELGLGSLKQTAGPLHEALERCPYILLAAAIADTNVDRVHLKSPRNPAAVYSTGAMRYRRRAMSENASPLALDQVNLVVRDVPRAVAFYRLLGIMSPIDDSMRRPSPPPPRT
jgi:hypothetical protein